MSDHDKPAATPPEYLAGLRSAEADFNGERSLLLATIRELSSLVSEGLDLCVRARKMDATDRRNATLAVSNDGDAWEKSGEFDRHVARHNAVNRDSPIATRSGTVYLWLQEQYEHDLAAWEAKARAALMGQLE
jgi:hypothetical protein